jgi:peroxiredoxin
MILKRQLISGLIMTSWLFAGGDTLKIGSLAPVFSLPDENGKECALSDYRGKRVVVYFFPKAETPG